MERLLDERGGASRSGEDEEEGFQDYVGPAYSPTRLIRVDVRAHTGSAVGVVRVPCLGNFRKTSCLLLGAILLLGACFAAAVRSRLCELRATGEAAPGGESWDTTIHFSESKESAEAKLHADSLVKDVETVLAGRDIDKSGDEGQNWPGSPVYLWNGRLEQCLYILNGTDVHLGMRDCKEVKTHEHFAYFKASGQIATYWGRQCLIAETFKINGAGVFMGDCNEDDPYQKWRYDTTTQQLQNGGGRCLDALGPHMWDCLPDAPPAQKWRLGRFWDHDTWQGDGPPIIRGMPEASPGEQAAQTAIYLAVARRSSAQDSFGFRVKATGVAKVTHVDSGEADRLSAMKRGDLVLAVDGTHAMRGVDVARLLENKTEVALKLRRSGVLHVKHNDDTKRYEAERERHNSDEVHEALGVPKDAWEPLRKMIHGMVGDGHSAIHVGNEKGLLFQYGEELLGDRKVRIASEMKLIHAVLAMRIMELGYVQLDDPLSKWLPWWPTNATDSRSYIKLRHCLSMTTGFYGVKGAEMDGRPHEYNTLDTDIKYGWREMNCKRVGAMTCARLVLKKVPHIAPPGVLWTYSNDHLRLSVAVLIAATGQSYKQLLKTHIFDRTSPPMRDTRPYEDYKYFSPGSAVYSTPKDYQRFLDAYFSGRLVSNSSAQLIESDNVHNVRLRWFLGSPRDPRPAGVGNFGFGVWRSDPVLRSTLGDGWCGYHIPCAFAPSHYDSVAVLVRGWGQEAPKTCAWRHSSTCRFYYHIQNMGQDDSSEAFFHNQKLSRKIEALVSDILSGANDPWQCHNWNAEDNKVFKKMGKELETQKKVCELNHDHKTWDFTWTKGNDTAAPGCGECWCCKRPHVGLVV